MSDEHLQESARKNWSRRAFLGGAGCGALAGGAAVWGLRGWNDLVALVQAPNDSPGGPGQFGLPGRFPGKVVDVHHPRAAQGNVRNREAVKAMLDRGLRELVGAPDSVAAWRSFFSKGDRVGIKVVPVGRPDSISSHEVLLEVIDSLVRAGVRASDVLVFERYEDEFRSCGYYEILPDGVHWECESVHYDEQQLNLDGQLADTPRSKRVSGYDRDVFRELAYCHPQHDPKDDRRFRSHLSLIISQKIDKFICIPVLKDHRSAGVTLALKNLSHGSVNNVTRSHLFNYDPRKGPYRHGSTINQCGTFIPSMVSLPKIRQKAALQILDGLVATYEGGPGIWNRTFATWNANSLLFATDPVALDHIGWEIIDRKRAAEGWPSVAAMGLEGYHRTVEHDGMSGPSEQFQMRQPEHVPLAGVMGLGVFERAKIDYRRVEI